MKKQLFSTLFVTIFFNTIFAGKTSDEKRAQAIEKYCSNNPSDACLKFQKLQQNFFTNVQHRAMSGKFPQLTPEEEGKLLKCATAIEKEINKAKAKKAAKKKAKKKAQKKLAAQLNSIDSEEE